MIKFEFIKEHTESKFKESLQHGLDVITKSNGSESIISVSHTVAIQGGTLFTALITYKCN